MQSIENQVDKSAGEWQTGEWQTRHIQVFFMARNKYIGSFHETAFVKVALPFNQPHLQELLEDGSCFTALYTHQQICDWGQCFALAVREEQDKSEWITSLEIIEDVGAQWDLFLYNTYSLSELQVLDFSQVRLPHEWFVDWLRRVKL